MRKNNAVNRILVVLVVAVCGYLAWGLVASGLGLSDGIRAKYALSRGIICYKNGKHDEAIKYYTEAIRLDPRSSTAYYLRGVERMDKKDYENAMSDLNSAIEISPTYAEAFLSRGGIYIRKNDTENAIKDLTRAIELNSLPEAYKDRALVYGYKGDYDKTISDSTMAIKINPNFGDAYRMRAVGYSSKGEYDKAWEDEHKAESLGAKIDTDFEYEFLEELKRASGRSE